MKEKHSLLTPKQRRFMLALQARLASNPEISPSYEELMKDIGVHSKSVISRMVIACEERGRLKRKPGKNRSLIIIHPVGEAEVKDQPELIKSFSDGELVRELVDRGVLVLKANHIPA